MPQFTYYPFNCIPFAFSLVFSCATSKVNITLPELVDPISKQMISANSSDTTTDEKFNVAEFYHQILWASQQQPDKEQKLNTCGKSVDSGRKKGKRVTFSKTPPAIYEYEPEYSKTNKHPSHFSMFDYQFFKRKFDPHTPFTHNSLVEKNTQLNTLPLLCSQPNTYVCDDMEGHYSHKLMKARSLTDFNPVPNRHFVNDSKSLGSLKLSNSFYSTSLSSLTLDQPFQEQSKSLPSEHNQLLLLPFNNNSTPHLVPPAFDDSDNSPPPPFYSTGYGSRPIHDSIIKSEYYDENTSNTSSNSSSSSSIIDDFLRAEENNIGVDSTATVPGKGNFDPEYQTNGDNLIMTSTSRYPNKFFFRTLRKITTSSVALIPKKHSMVSLLHKNR